MISQQEFLGRLTELLDEAGIPYMVAGSMSSSLHGHPRATQDVDLVVDPAEDQLGSFVARLEQEHYNLDIEYLREWARQLGVEDMLARLLQEAQERAERID